jgi:hypothetical protein
VIRAAVEDARRWGAIGLFRLASSILRYAMMLHRQRRISRSDLRTVFDRQMERDGIVEKRIGFIEDIRSRAMVYDMSGGVVGNVVRVLRIALRLAHRAKRRSIEWTDIETAFYSWKTTQLDDNGKRVEVYDPFENGPKERTLEAVEQLK